MSSLSLRLAYEPEPEERRQSERHAFAPRLATLKSPVFIETVKLVDVGRLGFSVRTDIAYPSGSPLVLILDGRKPLKAKAVWFSNRRLGARFDKPLSERFLLSLTAKG
jgi:hypothetical protein